MSPVSDWFATDVKPWHIGQYEVLKTDGNITRAKFLSKSWIDPDTKLPIGEESMTGWRGRLQQYSPDIIDGKMKSMESDRKRLDAQRLFRHWVSMDETKKACRYFEIGEKLGTKFKRVDKQAYRRLMKKLTINDRLKVKTSVDLFFGNVNPSALRKPKIR